MSGSVALLPGVSLENSLPVDGGHTPLTAVSADKWERGHGTERTHLLI